MTTIALWRHEMRRCGATALLPAAATVTLLALLGLGFSDADGLGGWLLRAAQPVSAGLAAAALFGTEPMLELQLTMPVAWAMTVCHRLAILVVTTTVCTSVLTAVLGVIGWLADPGTTFVLLAFADLAMAVVGCWSAVVLTSAGAASTSVLGVWLGKLVIADRITTVPVAQAGLMALVAVGVLALTMRRLGAAEILVERRDAR
jgi:hypothetical protein